MDFLKSFFIDTYAIVVSAILFGLSHLMLLEYMSFSDVVILVIGAATLGLLAGFVRIKSNNLIPGIIIHISFNAVSFILYYSAMEIK